MLCYGGCSLNSQITNKYEYHADPFMNQPFVVFSSTAAFGVCTAVLRSQRCGPSSDRVGGRGGGPAKFTQHSSHETVPRAPPGRRNPGPLCAARAEPPCSGSLQRGRSAWPARLGALQADGHGLDRLVALLGRGVRQLRWAGLRAQGQHDRRALRCEPRAGQSLS